MKKLVYVSVIALAVAACSTNETTVEQEVAQEEVAQAEPVADKIMTMEVNGMMCKMNCGGSIRKALKETGGVTRVEFDFEDGRETNVAKISFDSKLIDEKQMMEAVTSLYDGQYTIGNTAVNDITEEVKVEEKNDSSSDDEGSVVEAATSLIELPNLIDLFRSIITI